MVKKLASLRADCLAFTVPGELNPVADSNVPAPDHKTIQGECALKSPHNVGEHLTVLFQAIGVKRRHDAAPTEVLYPDDDVSDVQALTWP
jgi:hypothetical protein